MSLRPRIVCTAHLPPNSDIHLHHLLTLPTLTLKSITLPLFAMLKESFDLKTVVNTLEGGTKVWVHLPEENKIVRTACSYELIYSNTNKYLAKKHAATPKHTKNMGHTEKRQQILFETPTEN